MGVDYSANFGIGYKIKKVNDEILEEFDGDIGYFFDEKLQPYGEKIGWFSVGSGAYTGEEDEYFLIHKEPFKFSLDATYIKRYLDGVVDSIGLERDSEFGVVGGLLVC